MKLKAAGTGSRKNLGAVVHDCGSREPWEDWEQGRALWYLCFRKGCGRLGCWGQDGRLRPGRWGVMGGGVT